MTAADPLSETTPQGEQTLAAGVAPITAHDRLALRAAAPMRPRTQQKPCDLGRGACPRAAKADPWDLAARQQLDLFSRRNRWI